MTLPDSTINGPPHLEPSTAQTVATGIGPVSGLGAGERAMLDELVAIWQMKRQRNALRLTYYDGKNRLKDLGIAIPPPLRNLGEVIGWPAKAVDALAVRSRFDGYVVEGGAQEVLVDVLRANRFRMLYDQAVNSELICSCSFLTVSRGAEGEPPVLMSAYSALNASAVYDRRKQRVGYGMTVIEVDRQSAEPIWVNLYTDEAVIVIRKGAGGWRATRLEHAQGRPLIEPLVYRPTLDRPLGKSRISRTVMSITDDAVRTATRTEIAAEFFTTPQKYILGAPDDIFEKRGKWEAYIGNILALNKDADGEPPTFGQLPQMNMQPHIEHMRSLAARFSGETGIPISSLGVIHDNPASAEAIYAAKEDLIIEAEALNETNGEALRNIGLLVLAIAQDRTVADLPDDERRIIPRFKPVDRPSVVSQADAMIKQVTAIPWIAETQVALEQLGYTEEQIARMLHDRNRAAAKALLDRIASERKVRSDDEGDQVLGGQGIRRGPG